MISDENQGESMAGQCSPDTPAINSEAPSSESEPSSGLATMEQTGTDSQTQGPPSLPDAALTEYYGTKRVKAWPMAKKMAGDSDNPPAVIPGYGIQYADHYVSWSPADVFEASYQPLNALSFGHALEAMKAGHKVTRTDWGNGPYFYLKQHNDGFVIAQSDARQYFESVAYFTSNDLLANDWKIVA